MYNRDKILEECIKVIREQRLTFFTDLSMYIQPDISTLYLWEFEKLDSLKRELTNNKLASKQKMRRKWEDSDNAVLQLAAYKLIADQDELSALTMNRIEQTGNVSVTWKEERTYETK